MIATLADQPYRVLAGVPPTRLPELVSWAAGTGRRVVRLDLSGAHTTDDVCGRYATAFEFPFDVVGLDAVVSLVSDLWWWDAEPGYLLVVDGTGSAEPAVIEDATRILPAIVDRWRSQSRPFTAVLVLRDGLRTAARTGLSDGNNRLVAHARLPWAQPDTGPVDVVDGSLVPIAGSST